MFSLDLPVKCTLGLHNFTGSKPSAPPTPHYSQALHKLDKVGGKQVICIVAVSAA